MALHIVAMTQPAEERAGTFQEWKALRDMTDEQIADAVRQRGVEVKRAMISAILRRQRNAGSSLAMALRDLTGLPLELFLLATSPVPPSTSETATPAGRTCQLNGGAEGAAADRPEPHVERDRSEEW